MKTRQDFRYFDRLRVRWAEVDMQKIVFNGHYLMYADTAVAGYWRALALPYHDTMEALQGDLYVRKATLEYQASARYDDTIDVGIRTARIGTSSMLLQTAMFRGDTVLVHGELVYVFADPHTQTSQPVPESLRHCLMAFEGGAPPLRLEIGDWAALGAECQPLRDAVLVRELGLPAALPHDEEDRHALHAVARNGMGRAVACARVARPGAGGGAELQRFAVDASVRRSGVGRWLVRALLARFAEPPLGEPAIDTVQVQALAVSAGFWTSQGFAAAGQPYEAGGATHQRLQRPVAAAVSATGVR